MYSILCRNSETNVYYVNTWKKIKIKYLSFLRHVYFVYGHLQTFYSLFACILFRFCVLPVFLSLLFYREDIDVLYTFHVVLRVYFTNILCTFYRHYQAIFCVHFIDIFCSSFGGNFMKILSTFYLTHFIHVFFLEYFTKIMFSF